MRATPSILQQSISNTILKRLLSLPSCGSTAFPIALLSGSFPRPSLSSFPVLFVCACWILCSESLLSSAEPESSVFHPSSFTPLLSVPVPGLHLCLSNFARSVSAPSLCSPVSSSTLCSPLVDYRSPVWVDLALPSASETRLFSGTLAASASLFSSLPLATLNFSSALSSDVLLLAEKLHFQPSLV